MVLFDKWIVGDELRILRFLDGVEVFILMLFVKFVIWIEVEGVLFLIRNGIDVILVELVLVVLVVEFVFRLKIVKYFVLLEDEELELLKVIC